MTKTKKKYLALIAIVIIGGGYYWYNKSNSAVAPVQYKTAVAEKGTLSTSVSGSGNVTVDKIANVDPTISGTVANLAVNVGDKVKKGQLLFNIVNDQVGVDSAKGYSSYLSSLKALDSAKNDKKQAKEDYEDGSGADAKAILKKKIDIAEQAIVIASENVKVSLADYQNKKADARERNVISPIDGTVNAVNVKNGDDLAKVSSSSSRQAPVIVGDLSTLKAYVQVNEVDIPNIAIGQKVMLKFTAIDGLNISGKVEKMDSLGTVTQGVVTYNVTIGFDTLDSRLRPEMSVSASIITGEKENVVMIPNSAVKSQGSKYYVEILNGRGQTPVRKDVEIGAANNTDTEIVSGVTVGDKVVTQTINPGATAATTVGGGQGGGGGLRMPGLH